MSNEKAHFLAPKILDNLKGWGPSTIPCKYKDMPYQPFYKSENIGKVLLLLFHENLFHLISKTNNNQNIFSFI